LIQWVAPTNNGAVITGYQIEIQDSQFNWQSTSACNGTLPSVITSLSCVVSMDILSQTYGLQFGQVIYIRIAASNQLGFGAWSQYSSGSV